jgi:hypothetical protein
VIERARTETEDEPGPTSWVIVPAIKAVTRGWRKGISDPVPSSMRLVTAPIAVSVVSAS